jgi:hypothetical protein
MAQSVKTTPKIVQKHIKIVMKSAQCGCSEYDSEIRGRVIHFLDKFEVYPTEEYDVQKEEDGTVSKNNSQDSPETH